MRRLRNLNATKYVSVRLLLTFFIIFSYLILLDYLSVKQNIKCLRLTLEGVKLPVEKLITDLASIWILEKEKETEINLRQMSDAGIIRGKGDLLY